MSNKNRFRLNKTYLSLTIATILLQPVYAAEITEVNITDSSLANNQVMLESVLFNNTVFNNSFIPKDENGSYLTNNTNVIVDLLNGPDLGYVLGGMVVNEGSNNNVIVNISDTHIELKNGHILNDMNGGFAFVNNSSMAEGNVDVTLSASSSMSGGVVDGDVSGATAFLYNNIGDSSNTSDVKGDINLNIVGSTVINRGNVGGSIYGAVGDISVLNFATNSATNKILGDLQGKVNITDSNIGGTVFGVSSYNYSNLYPQNSQAIYNMNYNGEVYLERVTMGSSVLGTYALIQDNSAQALLNVDVSSLGKVQVSNSSVIAGVSGSNIVVDSSSGDEIKINSTGHVTINNSNVIGDVIASSVTVQNNQHADIYVTSINNSVTIQGASTFNDWSNSNLTNIMGGNFNFWTLDTSNMYYNTFTGNVLNFSGSPIKIGSLGNFEHYNFGLTNYNKFVINSMNPLIEVSEVIGNEYYNYISNVNGQWSVIGDTVGVSNVTISGISAEVGIQKNDKIVLLDASAAAIVAGEEGLGSFDSIFTTPQGGNTVQIGLTQQADISYDIDSANQKITAIIDEVRSIDTEVIGQNLKPLLEGRLSGLMNVNRGSDMVANDIWTRLDENASGSISPFVLIQGSHDRYNSGSHIKSNGYTAILGASYQYNDLLLGGLLEYGDGDYDTYNSFTSGQVHGDGNSKHYGLGIIGKLTLGNTYIDSSLRYGRAKTDFNTQDILAGAGYANYDSKANYFGGHIGVGYVYTLDDTNRFDSSLKYLYTQLQSDDVTIAGDKVLFDKSKSSRIQLREQWNHTVNQYVTVVGALAYEYEFNGEARGTVNGIVIDNPSLKGSTGIGEFGFNFTPFAEDANKYIDLRIKGYTGKHEGVAGMININYTF